MVFTSLEVASESNCSGLWDTGADPSCLVPGLAYENLEKKWALDSQASHLLEFASSRKGNPSRVNKAQGVKASKVQNKPSRRRGSVVEH